MILESKQLKVIIEQFKLQKPISVNVFHPLHSGERCIRILGWVRVTLRFAESQSMGWAEYTPHSQLFTKEPAVLLLFFCDVLITVVNLNNIKSSGPDLMIFTNWENAARIFGHNDLAGRLPEANQMPWAMPCAPRMPLCSSLGPLHHSGCSGGSPSHHSSCTPSPSVLHNDVLIQSGHCTQVLTMQKGRIWKHEQFPINWPEQACSQRAGAVLQTATAPLPAPFVV